MCLSIRIDEWCNIKVQQHSWASKTAMGEAETDTIYWQIREATSHPHHCTTSQVEDKDELFCAWALAMRSMRRETPSPSVSLKSRSKSHRRPLWPLIKPLKHSLNARMLVKQAASPTTSQARPSPLALAAIHVATRWKTKTVVPTVPFHHLCFSLPVPSLRE